MLRNWLMSWLRWHPPLKPAEVTTIAAEAAATALPQPSPQPVSRYCAPMDMVPIVYGNEIPVAVFSLDHGSLAYYHHPARSSHCFANETERVQ